MVKKDKDYPAIQNAENRHYYKSNALIKASYATKNAMTAIEQKLIIYFISKLGADLQVFQTGNLPLPLEQYRKTDDFKALVEEKRKTVINTAYQFRIKEVKDLLGMDYNAGYTEILKILRRIQANNITIIEGDDGAKLQPDQIISTQWFGARIFPKKGYFEILFPQLLVPYLIQLHQHYTSGQIDTIFKLEYSASLRLYELIRHLDHVVKKKGSEHIAKYPLDEFKRLLGFQSEEYKQFGLFNLRVIKTAIAEINQKTEYIVKIEPNYEGRKVTGVELRIRFKTWSDDCQHETGSSGERTAEIMMDEPTRSRFLNELIDLDINKSAAIKLVDNKPPEACGTVAAEDYLSTTIQYLKDHKDEANDLGPWARKALEDGWAYLEAVRVKEIAEREEQKRFDEEQKKASKRETAAAKREAAAARTQSLKEENDFIIQLLEALSDEEIDRWAREYEAQATNIEKKLFAKNKGRDRLNFSQFRDFVYQQTKGASI